jgi:hypothetical protein
MKADAGGRELFSGFHFGLNDWGNWRLNCVMALYLVVWHRLDKRTPRPFENDWLDNEILKSIRTTPKIGELCDEAKRQKHIVYHYCPV